jgi:hypothetical protein
LALYNLGCEAMAFGPEETDAVQDHEHPRQTRRNQYRYEFTQKHHGGYGEAQWLPPPSLSEDNEFAVFDFADGDADRRRSDDEVQCSDDEGNLLGVFMEVLPDGTDSLRILGSCQEQIARFWNPKTHVPTHGFPVYPIKRLAAPGHRKQHSRQLPPKRLLTKMIKLGWITAGMSSRLAGGKHV